MKSCECGVQIGTKLSMEDIKEYRLITCSDRRVCDIIDFLYNEIQQAHRAGWEQCKREAIGIAERYHGPYGVSFAIASMEYKGSVDTPGDQR